MALTIANPRFGNIFISANTFAELRSVSTQQIQSGHSAITSGGAASNDGAGGLFKWNPASAAADDNADVLAPADGQAGRWVRIHIAASSGGALTFDPADFGAVADGYSGSPTNNLTALNACLEAAALLGGVVQGGADRTYAVSERLIVPVGVKGFKNLNIVATATAASFGLVMPGLSGIKADSSDAQTGNHTGVFFEDCTIDCAHRPAVALLGLGCADIRVSRLTIKRCSAAVIDDNTLWDKSTCAISFGSRFASQRSTTDLLIEDCAIDCVPLAGISNVARGAGVGINFGSEGYDPDGLGATAYWREHGTSIPHTNADDLTVIVDGFTVRNCSITGGYYGCNMSGCANGSWENVRTTLNTRGFSCQNGNSDIRTRDLTATEFESVAWLCDYGNTRIDIHFLDTSSSRVAGAAPIELLHGVYGCRVAHVRNAVAVPESESFRTEIDIANVARSSLKSWSAEKLRDDLLMAFSSVILKGANDTDGNPVEDTYKSYSAASAGERNSFLVNNTDRILFGNVKANSVSGVMATALATIAAAQKLSAGVLSMAKTMARLSNPFKIRPYRTEDGREYYVLFVGPEGFRDLQADATIYAANKDARARDLQNPIFQSGDLIWNGIIIREIPEIALVGNVGASSASVGQAFLCGQGALALGYAKMAEPRVQPSDYDHVLGVGITEIRGQTKMSAAGVQTGMVTLFHAAAPDA